MEVSGNTKRMRSLSTSLFGAALGCIAAYLMLLAPVAASSVTGREYINPNVPAVRDSLTHPLLLM